MAIRLPDCSNLITPNCQTRLQPPRAVNAHTELSCGIQQTFVSTFRKTGRGWFGADQLLIYLNLRHNSEQLNRVQLDCM